MCMMKCNECAEFVNTDDDPDSMDFSGYEDKCICETCREAIEEFNTGGDMYASDRAEHGTHHKGNL